MTSNDTYYEGVFTGLNEVNGKGVMVLNNGDRISGTFDGTWADGIKMNNAVYQKYTPDNSMLMVCDIHRRIITFKLQCICYSMRTAVSILHAAYSKCSASDSLIFIMIHNSTLSRCFTICILFWGPL